MTYHFWKHLIRMVTIGKQTLLEAFVVVYLLSKYLSSLIALCALGSVLLASKNLKQLAFGSDYTYMFV